MATFPDLVDPTNTRTTRIYLFDFEHRIPGIQHLRVLFDREAPLSHFLQKNFRALPYFKKAGLRYLGAEVIIAPGSKIDILAGDKKSNELVAIELKSGEPDKGLVAQAGRYMNALKQKAARDGRPGAGSARGPSTTARSEPAGVPTGPGPMAPARADDFDEPQDDRSRGQFDRWLLDVVSVEQGCRTALDPSSNRVEA